MINNRNMFAKFLNLSAIAFFLCACKGLTKKEATVYESGFFRFIHRCDNSTYQDTNDNALVIVGFTDSGLKQESIDIPKEINGYPVKYIGLRDEGFSHSQNRRIDLGESVKNIFIFDNIVSLDFVTGSNTNIFVCANKINFTKNACKVNKIFVESSIFLELKDPDHILGYYAANVVFDYNYETNQENKLYRIDNLEEGEKINLPPAPTRKGFIFNGWFIDSECTEKWDFESVPDVSNNQLVLYGGWIPNE